jgi:hypothetical protein
MAKFSECSEADRIVFLKDEFIRNIEEIFVDPTEIKKHLSEDDFKKVMEFVPTLREPGCKCGQCIAVSKLESRIPKELECVIALSRKRCEERTDY